MCEASDLHRTPHSLPAQAIDQFGEHLFEGYAVKGVAGLGHRVWGGERLIGGGTVYGLAAASMIGILRL